MDFGLPVCRRLFYCTALFFLIGGAVSGEERTPPRVEPAPGRTAAPLLRFHSDGVEFAYRAGTGSVEIVQCSGKGIETLILPGEIEGQPVVSIANNAFQRLDDKPTKILVPDSITNLTSSTFWHFHNLEFVVISAENPRYSSVDGILFNKEKTQLIFYPPKKAGFYTVPEGVATIARSAFSACNELTGIALPHSLKSIGESAFSGCRKLREADLPASLESIAENAFRNCPELKSVAVGKGNPRYAVISEILFDKKEGKLVLCFGKPVGTLVLPKGTTAIPNSAFSYGKGLTNIIFPDSLLSIGYNAFSGCSGLEHIKFPLALESIGMGVFSNCRNLKSIFIPASIETIGNNAFRNCPELKSVAVEKGNPRYAVIGGMLFDKKENKPILCFDHSRGMLVLPEGTVSIPDSVFSSYRELTNIVFPGSLTIIGNNAFADCKKLKKAILPPSLETIGAGAFRSCTDLTTVFIPASVESIKQNPFPGCRNLVSLQVDANNPRYAAMNGALFDKDSMQLIHGSVPRSGTLVIPEGIVAIPYSAFSSNKGITNIVFPGSLASIGNGSFSGCSGLEHIKFPPALESIGMGAFSNCRNLKSISIPASVETIGSSAFQNDRSLESVIVAAGNPRYATINGMLFDKQESKPILYFDRSSGTLEIPAGTTSIPNSVFSSCEELTNIVFPDSLASIGKHAFSGCKKLRGAIPPPSLKTIGAGAFHSCTDLTTVFIPASVETIGQHPFYGCRNLVSIQVDEDNPRYAAVDNLLFDKDSMQLIHGSVPRSGTLVIPEGIVAIPDSAFSSNKGLANIVFPGSLASIGSRSFFECNSLESVNLPPSLASIEPSAFSNCQNLKSIFIPASVEIIGKNAFGNCQNLESIVVEEGNPRYAAINGMLIDKQENTLILTFGNPSGKLAIPEGITAIPGTAFHECDKLEQVVLPSSLKSIDKYAFYNCKNLSRIFIPASVESIEHGVFGNCPKLQSIVVEEGNLRYSATNGILFDKKEGKLVLCYGSPSGTLVLPQGLLSIPYSTFTASKELTNIVFPDSLISIGNGAFRGCDGLEQVVFPRSLEQIGKEAFHNCQNLSSVFIPASVKSIGENAFHYCRNLESIVVDEGNPRYIGGKNMLFDKKEGKLMLCFGKPAGTLVLPEGIRSIPESAFASSEELTNIVFPNSLVSIGNSAFRNCDKLEQVVFPRSLEQIGKNAFHNCQNLSSVFIPASVETIGENAFRYCRNLESIVVDEGNPRYAGSNGMLLDKRGNEIIQCFGAPSGTLVLPEGITTIPDSAFASSKGLTNIVFPDSLVSIGRNAFSQCNELEQIALPRNLETIGENAFGFCKKLRSVSFPDHLHSIGKKAFFACGSLTRVRIPDSLIHLGEDAFIGCKRIDAFVAGTGNPNFSSADGLLYNKDFTELVCYPLHKSGDVVLPDGVRSIGNIRFEPDARLASIVLPDSLETIPDSAFFKCKNLKRAKLPAKLKHLGKNIFCGSGLEHVVLPRDLESIGVLAFSYCHHLRSIKLPDGVKRIGDRGFSYCWKLENLHLPESVVRIGDGAFSHCPRLRWISIPSGIEEMGSQSFRGPVLESFFVDPNNPAYSDIDGVLFNKSATELIGYPPARRGSYTVPDTVVSIADSAFSSCQNLTGIVLPDSLESIGNSAFYWCTGLKTVVFPDSLKSIGNRAFEGCVKLESISIPNGVSKLGKNVFTGCDKLESVTLGSAGEYVEIDGVLYDKNLDNMIYCPPSLSGAIRIPAGIHVIPERFFDGRKGLEKVTLPDSLLEIETDAFSGCTRLEGIHIPAATGDIQTPVFRFCPNLEKITVAEGNHRYVVIDGVLFEKNKRTLVLFPAKKGGTYLVPDTVTTIAPSAFHSSRELKSITLPASLRTIGAPAFSGCTALESFVVEKGNPLYGVIDDMLFKRISGKLIRCPERKQGTVILPDTVSYIGDSAFHSCGGITGIVLPASLKSIGNGAFNECSNLTSATFLGDAPWLGKRAFRGAANGFAIRYPAGAYGFTSPTWHNYPASPSPKP